ncbi:MAG: uncharacterized protein A8A55_1199 [Amphiamblys sp. WSBS2006]|nr:MAG: uncharacterized protein A8A55_1199 [Amphiamblys sp. WSBS2006]
MTGEEPRSSTRAFEILYPPSYMEGDAETQIEFKEIGLAQAARSEEAFYDGEDVDDEVEIYLDEELREASRALETDGEGESGSELEEDFIARVGQRADPGQKREAEDEEREELETRLTALSITSATCPRSECMRKADACLSDVLRQYRG